MLQPIRRCRNIFLGACFFDNRLRLGTENLHTGEERGKVRWMI